MYLTGNEIDYWITEDLPYFDLTTHLLGIAQLKAKIRFIPRTEIILCGTEEVCQIFAKFGIRTNIALPSGTSVPADTVCLEGEGTAGAVHAVWKLSVNLLEYASGIATRTSEFVTRARSVNPDINVTVTRKVMPGTKKLATKAALCGNAVPHRLGLSETILIFEEHLHCGHYCYLGIVFRKNSRYSGRDSCLRTERNLKHFKLGITL